MVSVLSPRRDNAYAVFFYVRCAVSYHYLEELMAERRAIVNHATLNLWVVKYALLVAVAAQKRKAPTGGSGRADETYIKAKGRGSYLHRAVDRDGNTLDFMLSAHRDEAAATAFFARAVRANGWPDKVVTDRSRVNLARLENMNILLLLSGWFWLIKISQMKYLNILIERQKLGRSRPTREATFSEIIALRD